MPLGRFRRLFRRPPSARSVLADVDDEIRSHLDSRTEALIGHGLRPDEARAQAVREFGDPTAARDELVRMDRRLAERLVRRAWWFDLIGDFRLALRMAARQPGYAAAMLATLALGIGASTAIFTVINTALLQPLPYHRPDQLVHLWETHGGDGPGISEASIPDFVDWRAQSTTFQALEGYDETNITVTEPDGAVMVRGARVTSGFFWLLGVTPPLGRALAPGEDGPGGTEVVLLSDRYWRRAMGSDPGVVGRTLRINHRAFEIVGVLPSGFRFPPAGDAELWMPIDRSAETRADRGNHLLNVVGRLRDGVTRVEADRDLSLVMSRLAAAYPETNGGRGIRLVSLHDQIVGDVRPVLFALFAAAGLLLLIACSNVAGLLVARSLARSRELGVRAAIGASRGRLVRQLLTESLVLAAGGAAAGLLVATLGIGLLTSRIPDGALDQLGYLRDIRPDGTVVLFTASLGLFTALAFGLVPAWIASRVEVASLLAGAGRTTGGGTRTRLRDLLVAAQLAFTAVLLIGSALVGQSLRRLSSEDPGFAAEQVLTARIPLAGPAYQDAAAQQRFLQELLQRVAELPGVRGVGAVSNIPLIGGGTLSYRVEGLPEPDPAARPEVIQRGVAGDYFRSMGIPLVSGRLFTERDDSTTPLAIVINASLARQHFPSGDAVGRRFRFYAFPDTTWEIIGVVGDVKTGALDAPPPPTIYYSHLQAAENRMTLAIRAVTDPASLTSALRAEVRAMDPTLPVYQVSTLEDVVAASPPARTRRYSLVLIAGFGGAALLLALVGVYGVVAYSVSQRTRELGIRAALGATGSQILMLVLRRAAALVGVGIVAGCLLALGFGRFLGALLYRVAPTDLVTYLLVAAGLGAVALLASAVPARRAASASPASALRID
ncbi:MAG TPA: ABC transporter permease [Gemmatimonadales bacterium]